METTWQNTLAQLREYIQQNPSISIGSSLVSIPEDVRPEFYRLFDKVEADFVKENFAEFLQKGQALSCAWAEASRKVSEQLSLDSITVTLSLKWFLKDPLDGLVRPLSDPLFEVLKERMESAEFAEEGQKLVARLFAASFKEGYRRWVSLALLGLLAPDKNYRVPAVDEIADPLMGEGHENPGQHISNVPEAEASSVLSFQQHPIISFVVPKVLVWSVRLGRFVAMESEFVEPFWTARELSRATEWYDFTELKAQNGLLKIRPDQKILPDLTKILPDVAIYSGDYLEDIALVADHGHMMRPDLMIETMETADWYEKGKLETVKRHHAVLKPRFGTYIICREAPPQAALDELAPKSAAENEQTEAAAQATAEAQTTEGQAKTTAEVTHEPPLDIHIIAAGYDASRLEALIEALSQVTQPA